jgi:hypothetical protein
MIIIETLRNGWAEDESSKMKFLKNLHSLFKNCENKLLFDYTYKGNKQYSSIIAAVKYLSINIG